MNNPFIISSCKTYTTYSEFFIVSQNIIAFPHRRWLAAYVPTHHIRRHVLTSSNCDRYMRSAKCTSTDRVIKCDDRPIPISGRSIGASLINTFIISVYSSPLFDQALYVSHPHWKTWLWLHLQKALSSCHLEKQQVGLHQETPSQSETHEYLILDPEFHLKVDNGHIDNVCNGTIISTIS